MKLNWIILFVIAAAIVSLSVSRNSTRPLGPEAKSTTFTNLPTAFTTASRPPSALDANSTINTQPIWLIARPDSGSAQSPGKTHPAFQAYRPVLLVIKVQNQQAKALILTNLLSVLDSGLERSFNVNRLKNGLVKVHLSNPGLYKLVINEPGFKPYESWLRIENVKIDSLVISLVPAKSSIPMRKAGLINTKYSSADVKDLSWLNAYSNNFTLVLVLIILVAGMLLLTNEVKKVMIRLNEEVQHIIRQKTSNHDAVTPFKHSLYSLQGEVMITAGPRKKFETGKANDLDLGEDVCGLAIAKETAWFWLLDGTSDQSSVWSNDTDTELFSSRLLAQSLAIEFKELLPANVISPEMLYKSISKIRHEWLRRLESLSAEETSRLSDLVIENNPICSSTLLIGTLNTDGQCKAYRAGDSKMLVFGEETASNINPLKEHPGALNDRLFFRLTYVAGSGFDIAYNKPKIETHVFYGIDKMLAYSDGIGNELHDYLNTQQHQFTKESRRLIPYLRNMTSDDKSLCILERIEERTHLN